MLPPSLTLQASEATGIRDHARRSAPNECCGAVLSHGSIRWRIEGYNVDVVRPTHAYRMDAASTARIARKIEEGWTLEAIYHSHTHGTPALSETDVRIATCGWWWRRRQVVPGAAQLVVALDWRHPGDIVLEAYGWSPDERRFCTIALVVEGVVTRRIGAQAM